MGKKPIVKKSYINLLFEECRSMAVFAAERGKPVPASTAMCVADFEKYYTASGETQMPDMTKLVAAHDNLAKIVAPATPQAIVLINNGMDKKLVDYIGPTPLIRYMICVTVFSLVSFLVVVQSRHIDSNDINIFSSDGIRLMFQLAFLISASALGSSFSALYKVDQYIRNMTYDPNQAASYWIRFFLGIISGLIMSLVIKVNAIESTFLEPNIIRPILAILGGFSADLFYTFLNRMVETMKSLFEGSNKEILENRTQSLNLKAAQKEITTKVMLSEQLLTLQNTIAQNPIPENVKQSLDKMWEMLGPGTKHSKNEPGSPLCRSILY
ncbi:MAG: hypothetical protein ABIJ59_20890 [Pseudomonadota bacterium]